MSGHSSCSCSGCRNRLPLQGCARAGQRARRRAENPMQRATGSADAVGYGSRWSNLAKRAGGSGLQWCCKTCDAYRVSLYLRTLRGHALSLLSSARGRGAKGRFRGSFLIDIHDLLDMLWRQGGRCFYSGVPLRCASGPADWVWSIERLIIPSHTPRKTVC